MPISEDMKLQEAFDHEKATDEIILLRSAPAACAYCPTIAELARTRTTEQTTVRVITLCGTRLYYSLRFWVQVVGLRVSYCQY